MQNNNIVDIENATVENWKWPCIDEWFNRERWNMERKERDENVYQRSDPFKVIYSVDEHHIHNIFLELSSQPLTMILQEIIPDNSDILDKEPRINAQELYHVLEKLRIKKAELETASNLTGEKLYLKSLIKFLEQEYERTNEMRARMITQNKVSFSMLWVFYTPNLPVWYTCETSNQKRGGIISSTSVEFNFMKQQIEFHIKIKVIDYDSVGFKHCSIVRKIGYFKGEMSFSSLPVMPFEFSKIEDKMKKIIAENGKKFFKLAPGKHLKNYKGPLLRWKKSETCMILEKINANGRVMIDLESFAIMNPNYEMGNALLPKKCDFELLINTDAYLENDKEIQEADYLLAPAVVYGFSFELKQWGQFDVSEFEDIEFDKDALDYLVIPSDQKDIIKGLVSQYVEPSKVTDNNRLDPIRNKGNGCIFLCYGPPGTGKTLTAESVAEYLERPLWTLTVHELGTKLEDLEQQLAKVLYIAYKWNAVLLLDEADIYFERRSTSDLNRNMMVGIFLRLLEHYQGILFLTTNRVENFDEAICSRISMFLHYPELGTRERREIWTNFIKRAKLPLIADDFTKYKLNGREIRNVVNIVQRLARNKGEDLNANLVINIIEAIQKFKGKMINAKNYE
ncbi:P-loop containing nucleoside triphosphate hydrolase protein [Gigaspora rosea]|uniref:P-loop containing nucleoside triphosphate hydrolase protein n=1 Tax=Gigaspora rosea TaxID=44941 RepID=A0A397VRU9_9GLOM|nr:P-loop containing nucleoside triphosphate hydrolase protein [Gigaspora rosea]